MIKLYVFITYKLFFQKHYFIMYVFLTIHITISLYIINVIKDDNFIIYIVLPSIARKCFS